MTKTRTGLLIIRAWAEPGSSSPLRVQIRLTTDVSLGMERSEAITEAERGHRDSSDLAAGNGDCRALTVQHPSASRCGHAFVTAAVLRRSQGSCGKAGGSPFKIGGTVAGTKGNKPIPNAKLARAGAAETEGPGADRGEADAAIARGLVVGTATGSGAPETEGPGADRGEADAAIARGLVVGTATGSGAPETEGPGADRGEADAAIARGLVVGTATGSGPPETEGPGADRGEADAAIARGLVVETATGSGAARDRGARRRPR